MRHYFIDLENVRSAGLEGVTSLESNDYVYVFYSDNANTLTIPTLESINSSKARVKYIKTNYTGSNAMDFQIVAMFGAMIEREKSGSFYIISHDNGFRSAVSFCASYFTEYDIKLGAYATINATLTVEKNTSVVSESARKKHRRGAKTADSSIADTKQTDTRAAGDKNQSVDAAATGSRSNAPEVSVKAVDASAAGGKSNIVNAGVKAADASAAAKSSTLNAGVKAADASAAAKSSAPNPNVKAANDSVAGGKGSVSNAGVKAADDSNVSDDIADKKKNGRVNKRKEKKPVEKQEDKRVVYAYIYETLASLLSEKTIDIYAETIHDGIKKSRNRNDIHNFFRQKYGDKEGEALYKIIQCDFDAMKARCGNSPSQSGR